MKNINKNKIVFVGLLICILLSSKIIAQDNIVKIHYYNDNNSLQYLLLESNVKNGKIITPNKNKAYEIYLDSSTASNKIATIKTDAVGKAKAFLPVSIKDIWNAKSKHTFIVKAGEEEVITDYIITKAKIVLDTAISDEGVRSIKATVTKLEGDKWLPAADVEMKLGIKRLGGILPAADEQTYTTDSSGTVTVELKKILMPGDEKGNISISARVEENEFYGNMAIEKQVAWGAATKIDNTFFNQRTLWTTRFQTPYWLLAMAYSIVFGVWGTLIYLIFQVIKIKKLGAVKSL